MTAPTEKDGADVGPVILRPLPWKEDALEPVISARTVEFHYGRHHRAYVDKTNELLRETQLSDVPLEDVIRKTAGEKSRQALFNNAAQAWNHDFYWRCLTPGGAAPPDRLRKLIEDSFDSFDVMKDALAAAAIGQFGTGWGWLVQDGSALKVMSTQDADNPMTAGLIPLLTVDVWEHAYYLDYQNERPKYVKALIDRLANWAFADANLR
jgi:Fe-Mn family superoxide dismutase